MEERLRAAFQKKPIEEQERLGDKMSSLEINWLMQDAGGPGGGRNRKQRDPRPCRHCQSYAHQANHCPSHRL